MRALARRALLSRPLNRALRGALAPLPRRWLPGGLRRRLPVVGEFPVRLASGERFLFRSRGEYLGRVLYWQGVGAFEPGSAEVVARLARRSRCFWDVGAYGGLYTLIAEAARPGLAAVAFEPLPDNFDWLRANLRVNGLDGVEAVAAAVTGGGSDRAELWVPSDPWPSHSTVSPKPNADPARGRRLAVPAVSIDGFRERGAGPPPDLIKIDAEGAEAEILAGARRTLAECRPVLLCELLPRSRPELPALRQLLGDAGYRWGMVTPRGVEPRAELEPEGGARNHLLWPAEKAGLLAEAGIFAGSEPPARDRPSGAARRLDAVLARSPLQPLFRRRADRRLRVLAYHGVADPERFAAQLDVIAAELAPVSLERLIAALDGGEPLPPRAVLVTFDDGERSLFEAGLPRLAERGIPAVAFVIAGLIDTFTPPWWIEAEALAARWGSGEAGPELLRLAGSGDDLARTLKRLPDEHRRSLLEELRGTSEAPTPPVPQLTAAELSELAANGVAIGSHTWSHPILPRCADAAVAEEIRRAHEALTAALGRPPLAFAYPNGDADPRAERELAALGYRAAFLFDHRLSPARPPERFRISRLRVNSDTPIDRFRIVLSGLHPALHRLRGGR
jgi:FkbM family methyltransferase